MSPDRHQTASAAQNQLDGDPRPDREPVSPGCVDDAAALAGSYVDHDRQHHRIAPGSYADTDGVSHTDHIAGSYADTGGTSRAGRSQGSYADSDGARTWHTTVGGIGSRSKPAVPDRR